MQYVPLHADPRRLQEFDYRRHHLFYSANPMSHLPELINIFRDYMSDEVLYTSVVTHTDWPAFRKHYFLHRIAAPIYSKWTLLFKHLLRFFSWDNQIGEFLFPGFCYIGLRSAFLHIAAQHPTLYPKRFLQPPTTSR